MEVGRYGFIINLINKITYEKTIKTTPVKVQSNILKKFFFFFLKSQI